MWKITPIHTATQHCIAGGMLRTGDPELDGRRMDIPFVAWLLRNDASGDLWLVDCGPNFDNEANSRLHQPMTMQPEWHILARLAAMGISAGDVSGIIATHLHWDHLKAIIDLPAFLPVIAQRAELAWASASRGAPHGAPYESAADELGLPFFLRCYQQYELVDGEAEITPGISVFPVPGHTAGSQAIRIETAAGPVILGNDVVNVIENLRPGIEPGNVNDQPAYARSINRLREEERNGAAILPGHDFRIFSEFAAILCLLKEKQ